MVVNPFQNKELSPHIIEKQYREASSQALSIEPPMPRESTNFKVNLYFFLDITHLHMLYYVGVSIFSTLSFMLFIQVDYVGNVKDAEKIIQRIINEYRFFLLFIVLDIANLSNIDIQTLFSFTVCTLAS